MIRTTLLLILAGIALTAASQPATADAPPIVALCGADPVGFVGYGGTLDCVTPAPCQLCVCAPISPGVAYEVQAAGSSLSGDAGLRSACQGEATATYTPGEVNPFSPTGATLTPHT